METMPAASIHVQKGTVSVLSHVVPVPSLSTAAVSVT